MSAYTAPSTRQKHRQNGTSSPTSRGSTTAAADTQHSTTAGPTKSTTVTSSQPWQHKRNHQLRCPKTPQQPSGNSSRTPREAPVLEATGPGQVWSWDITDLRSPWRGVAFKGYSIIDIYSRKIVGWRVEE